MSSAPATTVAATASPPFDFHTVTCVAWSASGRNFAMGTPDGFLIYSTEPLLSRLSDTSVSPTDMMRATTAERKQDSDTDDTATLQEVFRCVVYGGVGLLCLHRQCSIVTFTGVQRRTDAARIQLADISQSFPASYYAMPVRAKEVVDREASSVPRCKPWPPEEDAAVAQWYERWRVSDFANAYSAPASTVRTLAFVHCPPTVVALQFCPQAVIAASSGDPKITGSHTLYVFDHHLHPLYTLPVYPPSSNAFLKDMVAIATTSTLSNGAGMEVWRLRVLLPGERRGEVRLLTFKKSTLTATAYDEASPDGQTQHRGVSAAAAPHGSGGGTHRLVDKVLHQAPLRAVAITDDGRSGVTMSEQGMRIRLLDFVGDDKIVNRLTLDRGHLPAVTETVSLAVITVPQVHLSSRSGVTASINHHERCGSNDPHAVACAAELPNGQYQRLTEVVHNVVVCLTSSGTTHVFGCGQQQVLFYHSDKTLLPRAGYPYAFTVCLPLPTVKDGTAMLFVVRTAVSTLAAHYLPRLTEATGRDNPRSTLDSDGASPDEIPGEFFAFQLGFTANAHPGARGGTGLTRACCTALTRCVISAQ